MGSGGTRGCFGDIVTKFTCVIWLGWTAKQAELASDSDRWLETTGKGGCAAGLARDDEDFDATSIIWACGSILTAAIQFSEWV